MTGRPARDYVHMLATSLLAAAYVLPATPSRTLFVRSAPPVACDAGARELVGTDVSGAVSGAKRKLHQPHATAVHVPHVKHVSS